MTRPWLAVLGGVLVVSAVPLVAALLLPRDPARRARVVPALVSFAAGALLGGAFLHLIPEALATGRRDLAGWWLVGGFVAFFALERWLRRPAGHGGPAHAPALPPLAALNLVGDGVHNLVDGMAIGAAFLVAPSVGVATTVAVALHEVPQELGDYGVLLFSGLAMRRAVLLNAASGLTAIVGAVLVLLAAPYVAQLTPALLALAAGNFLYIASAQLLPHLRASARPRVAFWQLGLLCAGVLLSALARFGAD